MALSSAIVMIGCVVGSLLIPLEVSAWTYDDNSWWFGSEQNPVGNLGITYSYSDSVYLGETIEVAVTLEYIKNDNARSNYVIFTNVVVDVMDNLRSTYVVGASANQSSGIIKPGEHVSYLLKIPSSGLAPNNEYAVDLSFLALFSRSTSLDEHYWDSGVYLLSGYITPNQLPNIVILDRPTDETIDNTRELTIGIKKPYTFINPVNFTVDGSSYRLSEANRLTLPASYDTEHVVTVPDKIELVGGIQAVFVNWADGSSNTKRNVNLDTNKELFAIYKTQYHLDISSEFGTPNGGGWYDSGSNAAFSVEQTAGALSLHAFDKWEGDYSSSDSFGTILMDGPKTLLGTWKFEIGIIAGLGGTIAAVIAIGKLVPPAVHKLRSRRAK
jgi:hypothetical protein